MYCPPFRRLLSVAIIVLAAPVLASSNHLPQPWRPEAVTKGRDVDYNLDWFLQIFSYRHISPQPNVVEDGLRGTGGSITSKRLYYDLRFRKDFVFSEKQYGFLLDMQRSEDFDGEYDRQLVGLRYNPKDSLEFWLQGDVFPNKSLSDVYLSSRYRFSSGHWLHLSWIKPDLFFNEKTNTGNQLIRQPQNFFLQWHQQATLFDSDSFTLISLNYSPQSELDSQDDALRVKSQSIRGALTFTAAFEHWVFSIDIDAERSQRHYRLYENFSQQQEFNRYAIATTASIQFVAEPYRPKFGLRYVSLKEEGYYGRNTDQSGSLDRREPLFFLGGTYSISDSQSLVPTIYLGHAKVKQSFNSGDWKEKDEDEFIGKFMLPWNILVSRKDNANLTFAMAIDLHDFGFGGGNIQIHWPM